MMACGFSESYVKLWSLTGQPLRGLRSNIDLKQIQTGKFIDVTQCISNNNVLQKQIWNVHAIRQVVHVDA
jgi:hypothetical protein